MTFRSQPKNCQIRRTVTCDLTNWRNTKCDIMFCMKYIPSGHLVFIFGQPRGESLPSWSSLPVCRTHRVPTYPWLSSASERFSFSKPDLPYSGLRDPSTHTFSESWWCELSKYGQNGKQQQTTNNDKKQQRQTMKNDKQQQVTNKNERQTMTKEKQQQTTTNNNN